MKKINITIFATFIIAFFSCNSINKDSEYFSGKIYSVNEDNLKIINNITSKVLPIEDYNFGLIAAYDSLIIYWNPKLQTHFFKMFNVDTGKELGLFCNRGKGHNETISVGPVMQLFKKGVDISTLIYAYNEGKIFMWNIDKSIKDKRTIYDTVVDFNYKNKDKLSRYNRIFYKNNDILFARIASVPLNSEESTTLYYQKYNMCTNNVLQDYHIYKKSVRNGKASVEPSSFYYSSDFLKPDGSKIVMAMRYLPQINIIDTNTGDVVGFRMPEGPGFSLFETKMKPYNIYYNSVQADDNYIYAAYWGKKQWEVSRNAKVPILNTIHVFDWQGNLLYKIKTDRSYFRIWLDQGRNRLYTTDIENSEVSYIDLSPLLKVRTPKHADSASLLMHLFN